MVKIIKLKDRKGEEQYPITTGQAVKLKSGKNLDEGLNEKLNKNEVPTKLSQLENDEDFITKTRYGKELNDAIMLMEAYNNPTNGYTGHADIDGLLAIGWNIADILHFQKNDVDWNAEDDHLHKVSDYNKSLYGVVTWNNLINYFDNANMIYLPKIYPPADYTLLRRFSQFEHLTHIALNGWDTTNNTSIDHMFYNAYNIKSIPWFDTSNVIDFYGAFKSCQLVKDFPRLNTSNGIHFSSMFRGCYALTSMYLIDTTKAVTLDFMFAENRNLESLAIPRIPADASTNSMLDGCISLSTITSSEIISNDLEDRKSVV